jgi:hypothetical protein
LKLSFGFWRARASGNGGRGTNRVGISVNTCYFRPEDTCMYYNINIYVCVVLKMETIELVCV